MSMLSYDEKTLTEQWKLKKLIQKLNSIKGNGTSMIRYPVFSMSEVEDEI